ncbi:MAG TPA: HD domain-containing phosphohydrolase [Pyrinomonadaceae bacterium]|jgi:response regulator RpfG family c-di-GMP phosphodiesterase
MFDVIETEKSLLLISENRKITTLLENILCASYACDTAETVETAFARLRENDYSVVLCSANLPSIDALEMISHVQAVSPNSILIVLGDENAPDTAVRAFRAGVFDFLRIPDEIDEIDASVARAAEAAELKTLKDNYQFHLESLAAERATEIDKALEEIESSYRITLKALVQALETRDFETHGHSERVVTFSLRLGHELGLDKEAMRDLELGALLHDIGKIGVPDAVLRKPAKLNAEEWKKMRLHPLHGQKILRNIKFLEGAARVVCQHHEQWDGSGYPYGLRGEDIDIGARIFAVVDAFDAMISDRVYRKGRPYEDALEELERCSGQQFDPLIVEAFKHIPKEDWEILRERSVKDKQEIYSFQAVVAELVHSRQQFELIH